MSRKPATIDPVTMHAPVKIPIPSDSSTYIAVRRHETGCKHLLISYVDGCNRVRAQKISYDAQIQHTILVEAAKNMTITSGKNDAPAAKLS